MNSLKRSLPREMETNIQGHTEETLPNKSPCSPFPGTSLGRVKSRKDCQEVSVPEQAICLISLEITSFESD